MIRRVLISGGGSGGHIHPALAIADEIVRRYPQVHIRFVGAKGRMEMEKVPQAGYEIDGLWISGLQRNVTNLKNISFPIKLIYSLIKAGKILKLYNPEIVIGVGGYASGPLLYRASQKEIPTLIQEQNSFPGITNRILASRVKKVCAGFPGLDRWFPQERIVETGNPLRQSVLKLADSKSSPSKSEAISHFNLDTSKPVVFIMGGSLGAQSMNLAVRNLLENSLKVLNYSLIWQCGSRFLDENDKWLVEFKRKNLKKFICVKCVGFIDRMDFAYAASDLIASRAGAMSISELALVAKPTILIPSPNVAEDHQTKNAMSLVDRGAAILIKDGEVIKKLKHHIDDLLQDKNTMQEMVINLKNSARPNASIEIVDEVEKLLKSK
jgi:UDP-N-acetylglucosamine--N-acetylmuramyl-(pentapeptide) pyrophosphoryl-undecaprenol N-acetylglucosamine transferase